MSEPRKKPGQKRKRSLSIRERKFLVAYLDGATGAESARRAGYSKLAAREIAHRLITKAHIKAAIATELKKRQLSPEEVIAEIEAIAKSSIKAVWNEDGQILLPHQLPDRIARAVRKFKIHPTNGVEVELYSKPEALALLARIHKLLIDRQEHTGKDGGAIETKVTESPMSEADRLARALEIARLLREVGALPE